METMTLSDLILLVVFVVAWVLLVTKVAPRLGFPT
jgi:hypothetical protein